MRSHEKPNPTHISPSIMIKVTLFLKPHHMIRLQTLWTFVFYSFCFPNSLCLSLPLLFLPQFSNKQQSPITNFQQIKKKQKQMQMQIQMQMHMQKPEADLQPFFHSLLFSLSLSFFQEDLMLEIILSNVCFVIFWEPLDTCPVLKTGRFDRGSKGSLKISIFRFWQFKKLE